MSTDTDRATCGICNGAKLDVDDKVCWSCLGTGHELTRDEMADGIPDEDEQVDADYAVPSDRECERADSDLRAYYGDLGDLSGWVQRLEAQVVEQRQWMERMGVVS